MTGRKFHRTVFTVEVLSEEMLDEDLDLEGIAHLIDDGPCVGRVDRRETAELDGAAVAAALGEFGSDSSFFDLDEDGNDLG